MEAMPYLRLGPERDVLAFFTDSQHPEEGVIAPANLSFKCPIRIPGDGVLKRFFVQMPAGPSYQLTVRLFYETQCKVPLPGYGYIMLDNGFYDNPYLHIPVSSGKFARLEVANHTAIEQKLFALIEIELTELVIPPEPRSLPGRPLDP